MYRYVKHIKHKDKYTEKGWTELDWKETHGKKEMWTACDRKSKISHCSVLTFDPAQKCYSKVMHRKEVTHSNGQ